MNRHIIFWLLILLPAAVSSGVSKRLEIYLPRTVHVEGDVINLGHVGIVQGPQALADRAEKIPLGRFSIPGQQIILDRETIGSCLAGGGISAKQVRFSGAERIVVSRNESKLTGQQLITAARAFLESQTAGRELIVYDPPQVPKAWIAEDSKPIEVTALPGQDRIFGKRTVLLSLRQEGREIGRVPVEFEVRFQTRQAVAVQDIAAGEVIRKELIRFETRETKESQSADPDALIGATAKRPIEAGRVICADWLQAPVPPVLVQRRQKVILKIDTGLMVITASGEAMDEGAAGEIIRVKRGRRPEERIVLGMVMPDGMIEPLLGKGK